MMKRRIGLGTAAFAWVAIVVVVWMIVEWTRARPEQATAAVRPAPRYRQTLTTVAKQAIDKRLYALRGICRPPEQLDDIHLTMRVKLVPKNSAVWVDDATFVVNSGPKLTPEQEICIRQKLAMPFLVTGSEEYIDQLKSDAGATSMREIAYTWAGRRRCKG